MMRLASLENSDVFKMEEVQKDRYMTRINLMSTSWVNIGIYEKEHIV